MKRWNDRWGRALILSIVLAITVGCAHRSGSTVPVSPWEKVMVQNAALAQIVNDAEQGTETLATTGVITIEQARPFIKWERQIAEDHKPITGILSQGSQTTFDKIDQIQAFVDTLGKEAQGLISSGSAGIKNPRTQQALSTDVAAIQAAAKAIMDDIQAAKGVQ